MDFTREPIIETIVTPKEGCKLVVRSSRGTGQEEYFVDAVEVVSFGHSFFFRSIERPKPFLLPATDYEIVEVREARMVLKNAGPGRSSIKIGGGREAAPRPPREQEREQPEAQEAEEVAPAARETNGEAVVEQQADGRLDKKKDRRRPPRKRRGRDDANGASPLVLPLSQAEGDESVRDDEGTSTAAPMAPVQLSALLQPPPALISETISRYREDAHFKDAFFSTEEAAREKAKEEAEEAHSSREPSALDIEVEGNHNHNFEPHSKVQQLLNEEDEEFPLFPAPEESQDDATEHPESSEEKPVD